MSDVDCEGVFAVEHLGRLLMYLTIGEENTGAFTAEPDDWAVDVFSLHVISRVRKDKPVNKYADFRRQLQEWEYSLCHTDTPRINIDKVCTDLS